MCVDLASNWYTMKFQLNLSFLLSLGVDLLSCLLIIFSSHVCCYRVRSDLILKGYLAILLDMNNLYCM